MEPLLFGLGFASSLVSTFGGMSAAKHEAEISQQEAGVSMDVAKQQMAQNGLRQQQMELSARRSQIEVMRNAQRARSMAVQSGVSQTGSTGAGNSGVVSGIANTDVQGNYNLLGINQNLSLGRANFGLENNISQDKIQMAGLQSKMASAQSDAAMWQGLGNFGSSMMKISNPAGNMFAGSGPGPSGVFDPSAYWKAPTWIA